jgi:hypothetical protein
MYSKRLRFRDISAINWFYRTNTRDDRTGGRGNKLAGFHNQGQNDLKKGVKWP